MLTIPESVKTLFKTDGIRHNFRASFPNGELPDITNADVVRESLHFTESLCSQDPFKFGLSEASVIEFETVGIGNMYGMTIVCGIEIDTSSLSAAQISAIQSDPGDGTLVLAAASDIGYGYYRVPLGTFKVTSCPRNHGTMAHRKVTAMSMYAGGSFPDSPYQYAKLASKAIGQTRLQNLSMLLWAGVGYRFPAILDGLPVERQAALSSGGSASFSKTVGGVTIRGSRAGAGDPYFQSYSNRIKVFDLPQYDTAAVVEWARSQFAADPDYAAYADAAAAAVSQIVSGSVTAQNVTTLVPVVDGRLVYYGDGWSYGPSVVHHIDIYIDFPGGTVSDAFDLFDFATAKCKVLGDSSFQSYMIRLRQTGEQGAGYYTYVNSYDFGKLLNGWLEILGQFGRQTRSGEFEMVTLDDSAPIPVNPANYESCWWDEYDVTPVGTVRVVYSEENNTGTADIIVGDGQSIYDMSDNVVFDFLANADLSVVETMINTHFTPNLPAVAFTPVEMTMQGWPWIEAGDALEITAEDGTVIDTFALRVELSGIQRLSMDVESKAGEIIGEV